MKRYTTGSNEGCFKMKNITLPKSFAKKKNVLNENIVCNNHDIITNHQVVLSGKDDDNNNDADIDIITKSRPKTKKPDLYKVVLLNDDYTPMDFVISVLEHFFNKGSEDATQIMLEVHRKGVGIAGVYTYEVAETKVEQVTNFSRQHEHPLQCTMEKE